MLRLCVVAGRRRLELDQRQAFERVHRDIQRLSSVAGATATAGQREQTQRIGVGRAAVHRRPQLRRAGFAGDDADGLAEQVLRRQAQQVRAVLARLQDHQVAGPQHQQRAMRLNATGRLHRLGIAIGQRDAVPLDTVGPARPGQRRGRRGRQGHRCPFKVRTALSPACPPARPAHRGRPGAEAIHAGRKHESFFLHQVCRALGKSRQAVLCRRWFECLRFQRCPCMFAYETCAVQAFEPGAIDYLVKPFKASRLAAPAANPARALSHTARASCRLSLARWTATRSAPHNPQTVRAVRAVWAVLTASAARLRLSRHSSTKEHVHGSNDLVSRHR